MENEVKELPEPHLEASDAEGDGDGDEEVSRHSLELVIVIIRSRGGCRIVIVRELIVVVPLILKSVNFVLRK